MPYSCSVPKCKGNRTHGPKVAVFSFPREPELREKWMKAIKREFEPTAYSKVCELHFLQSEVIRETTMYNKDTGQTITAPLKCARLREGAVPSIIPDVAPNLTSEMDDASSDTRKERSDEDCDTETIQVEDGSNDSITVGVSSEDEEITEIPPDDPLAPAKQAQPEDAREEPSSPGIPENITEVVKLPAEALSDNLLEIGGIRKGASDDEDSPMIIDERRSKKSRTILAEVTLDDDDDDDLDASDKRKGKKGPKILSCCNLECSSRQELQSAPVFVLTYYGRKHKSGHPEFVCAACYKIAQEHQEHLAYLLSQHKPLFTAQFPSRNDTVVLSDSDEEETDGDFVPEDVIQDLQSKLKEVIESVTENYNVDFQIDQSKQILIDRVGNLKEKAEEIDTELNELQKKVDALRNGFYREFTIPTKHLGELTIDDQHHPKAPIRIMTPFAGKKGSTSTQQMRSQHSLSSSNNSGLQSTTQGPDSPRRPVLSGVAMKKVTQRSLSSSPVKETSSTRQEDIVAIQQIDVEYKPLPPIGLLTRPRPRPGDNVYVMKLSFYGVWVKAKVLEVTPKGTELPNNAGATAYNTFKVKLESSYRKSNPVKQVTGKQLAYPSPSPVRLHVGTRVIAIFRDNEWVKECYYAGVIAEPPKSMNKFRYLVFFDDGYAQYVSHEKILVVVEASTKVWEDIHPDSRPFIRKYLEQYPERPMVKMQEGQIVKTEWNGKWWIARVVEVDCSLVKMHFDADSRTEWIYRGSTRLGPLYAELQNAAQRNVQGSFSRHRGLGVASLKKRNMPYVEYTRGTEGDEKRDASAPSRAVAKKSTTKRPDTPDRGFEQPQYTLDKNQNFGKVEVMKLETDLKPKEFTPHQCGPICIEESLVRYTPELIRSVNPLMIPMKCGFRRQNVRCHGKRVIMYTAPCGRRLRTMVELHRYLRLTKSTMAVDLFDFDIWVNCFKEFKLEPVVASIKDLSYGKEQIPVSCVNTFDRNLPEFANYSTKRQPTEGVDLNLDPEFLIGCDCTDDCQDKEKCACWQLTIQGTAYGPGGMVDPTVGYYYRRLPEPVMTGIYECNSRCKCAKTCLNRVAQQSLHLKLQVFMTERKGWGIRCLNDVPQGAFICIYAGNLLTEQGANEGGKNYGDEYLAELDYIEVVEKLKEGYESDVMEDEEMCDDKKSTPHKRTKLSSALEPQHVSEFSEEEEEEDEEDEDEDDDDLMPQHDTRDSDEEFHPSCYDKGRNSMPTIEQTSMRTRLRDRTSRTASDDSDKRNDKKAKPEPKKPPEEPIKEALPKKSSRSISSDAAESDEEEMGERQPSKFAVDPNTPGVDTKKPKLRSVREFFGSEEYCYIMDAKNNGNIGRYLNHSCNPNVFVQNVFVDTHDLRFPWVAFFALTYINSGTELTWDYNYDVGSVPGKVLHCYCESAECRGRLL